MNIVRKYCMRCNGEIYTTWRTLDDTKYYHPHCFTCVDCGVILESIPEYGVATHEEIYCRRCHADRLSAYETDQRKFGGRSPTTVNGISKEKGYSMKVKTSHADNVDILFSSPSQFSKLRDVGKTRTLDENGNGVIGNIKKKKDTRSSEMIPGKNKVVSTKKKKLVAVPFEVPIGSINDSEYGMVQHKSSRIPRPTSAVSKKSLTFATSTPLTPKTKVSRNLVSKSKNSISIKPPPSPVRNNTLQKIQRSISLIQARSMVLGAASSSNNAVPTIKPNRSSSQSRPRSALSAREDNSTILLNCQQRPENYFFKPASSGTKRQCAASFSSKRKKEQSKNSSTILNTYTQQLKGGIPSTQAILSAIKREGSDVFKLKSSTQIPFVNTNSYDVLPAKQNLPSPNNNSSGLPKRSFNMTFECPICISSLVPGGNNEKGFVEGNSLCRNVVTVSNDNNPCGHLFHLACMENWLKMKGNKRCPICSALCLPETLQPVYLECNLCADLNLKSSCSSAEPIEITQYRDECKTNYRTGKNIEESQSISFKALRSQYDLLKTKYNEILSTNQNCFLNAAMTNSLQSAYDMECRSRLQLQWENRMLSMKIEELKNATTTTPDNAHQYTCFIDPHYNHVQ